MSSRHAYRAQAQRYDQTRAASPSVLAPLREALRGAPGPELLDVGGGTGNYAAALREEGWAPTVLDATPEMLAHAATKGLPTVAGDAAALPFGDASFDAVMLVSMIHHVEDWPAALREAARVVRPCGHVAVMCWTREHAERVMWLHEYFPSTRAWMLAIHEPLAALTAPLPGARAIPLFFEDIEDKSVGALQRHPELLLDPATRAQTSYFERLADRAPDELAQGSERLRADLAAGRDPNARIAAARAEIGDATVIAWVRPPAA